jgi:hypothetical protein
VLFCTVTLEARRACGWSEKFLAEVVTGATVKLQLTLAELRDRHWYSICTCQAVVKSRQEKNRFGEKGEGRRSDAPMLGFEREGLDDASAADEAGKPMPGILEER